MNSSDTLEQLNPDQRATMMLAARRIAEEQGITRAAAVDRIKSDSNLLCDMISQIERIGPAASSLVNQLVSLVRALENVSEMPQKQPVQSQEPEQSDGDES